MAALFFCRGGNDAALLHQASMAAKPRAGARRSRLALCAFTPPKAMTGIVLLRARRAKRMGPSGLAPGWLVVVKTGDNMTTSAPARAARRSAEVLWAAAVIKNPGFLHAVRKGPRCARDSERWTPSAPSLNARGRSAASRTFRPSRCARATVRRASSSSASRSRWRRMITVPRGKRANRSLGSGKRVSSVNRKKRGVLTFALRITRGQLSRPLSFARLAIRAAFVSISPTP